MKVSPISKIKVSISDDDLLVNPDENLIKIEPTAKLKIFPFYKPQGLGNAQNEVYMREKAFIKLVNAANQLPSEINLLVLDGWRPLALQNEILADFKNKAAKSVEDVTKFVFDPSQVGKKREYPTDDPPHRTGGAVDVTLISADTGDWLDMGTEFDEITNLAETNYFENPKVIHPNKDIIKQNRRLLYFVMASSGFTNYPGEWWHFDYGNAFWRFYSKNSATNIYRTVISEK
jgi:D-alanyl-D-alanine dipeptidase